MTKKAIFQLKKSEIIFLTFATIITPLVLTNTIKEVNAQTQVTKQEKENYSSTNYKTPIKIIENENSKVLLGNVNEIESVVKAQLDIIISTPDEIIYKPNRATLTAKITKTPNVNISSKDVKYIMLPVDSSLNINSKDEFYKKFNSIINTEFKGTMHQIGTSDVYNMYDTYDDTLNGIKNNCTLWIIVEGTDTISGKNISKIVHHTFTNIYSHLDIYHRGVGISETGKLPLYGKTRLGGDKKEYGVPTMLYTDDTVPISQLSKEQNYEKIFLEPLNGENGFAPQWVLTDESKSKIKEYTLDNYLLYKNTNNEILFEYKKDTNYWLDIEFRFENKDGKELIPEGYIKSFEILKDFAPSNEEGNGFEYFSPYYPPDIKNHKPIGYIIDKNKNSVLKSVSFPYGFGNVTIPNKHTVITIVYDDEFYTVTEEYKLYDGDTDTGIEVGTSPAITAVQNTGSEIFTPEIPYLKGYVYSGYKSVLYNNDVTLKVSDYPLEYPLETPLTPLPFKVVSDSTIIYKYKKDTTQTEIPDELQRKVIYSGKGINSNGTISNLYKQSELAILNSKHKIVPEGLADIYGNPIVFTDDNGSKWILSDDKEINNPVDREEFNVKGDKNFVFYYFEDKDSNGINDFKEADLNINTMFPELKKTKTLDPFKWIRRITR